MHFRSIEFIFKQVDIEFSAAARSGDCLIDSLMLAIRNAFAILSNIEHLDAEPTRTRGHIQPLGTFERIRTPYSDTRQ